MCNANHTDLLLHHHHHDHDQRWYSTTGGDARRSRAWVRGGVFFRSTWAQPNRACQVDPSTERGHGGGGTDLLDECGCLRQVERKNTRAEGPPPLLGDLPRRRGESFGASRGLVRPPPPDAHHQALKKIARREADLPGEVRALRARVLPIDLSKTTTLIK